MPTVHVTQVLKFFILSSFFYRNYIFWKSTLPVYIFSDISSGVLEMLQEEAMKNGSNPGNNGKLQYSFGDDLFTFRLLISLIPSLPALSTSCLLASPACKPEPLSREGGTFFCLVLWPPFEHQTIWQPDMFGPFEYQTSPVFRWFLYRPCHGGMSFIQVIRVRVDH